MSANGAEIPAIVADAVAKRYPIKHGQRARSGYFGIRTGESYVDALQPVSFVVNKGESVGVLGKNGSGKSTLLKIVAGGEAPTEGRLLVSSRPTLLGVSPALQKNLTGEQNILLGCLAMGMSRREAKKAIPEIAQWSGIGEAVKRPMNTYSTGMNGRLSFAISTARSPDILLVDETLATGDATFTARAEARMRKMLDRSGTLLLVSHSIAAIRKNCSRAIWLDDGTLIADGPAEAICDAYARWAKFHSVDNAEGAEIVIAQTRQRYPEEQVYVIDE